MKKLLICFLLFVVAACPKDSGVIIQKDEAIKNLEQQIILLKAENSKRESDLQGIIKSLQYDLHVEKKKLEILSCESGFRHDGIFGDNGKSYGIAQFKQKTFVYLRGLSGNMKLKYMNKEDQKWLLDWAIRNGQVHNWTCAKK
jgi:hypothetical protein